MGLSHEGKGKLYEECADGNDNTWSELLGRRELWLLLEGRERII